jgi:hypothetical protein
MDRRPSGSADLATQRDNRLMSMAPQSSSASRVTAGCFEVLRFQPVTCCGRSGKPSHFDTMPELAGVLDAVALVGMSFTDDVQRRDPLVRWP